MFLRLSANLVALGAHHPGAQLMRMPKAVS
jgi:hypothetical protein